MTSKEKSQKNANDDEETYDEIKGLDPSFFELTFATLGAGHSSFKLFNML